MAAVATTPISAGAENAKILGYQWPRRRWAGAAVPERGVSWM